MRYPYFLSLLFALLCVAGAKGQHNEFSLLKSTGDIPADFIQPASVLIQNNIQRLGIQSVNAQYFVWASENVFSYFVNSGVVTIGDSISILSSKIMDRLLSSNKEMRNKLNVYLLRSYKPEIYTFYTGNILISTGIVARTNTEAQLAYLIARELIFYRNRFEGNQSNTLKPNFTKDSLDLEHTIFALPEDEESAIDRQAMKMFLDAGYNASEAIAALKILYNPEGSFDDRPFSIRFFEHGDYIFPQSYHLHELEAADTNSFNEQINYQISRRIKRLTTLVFQVETTGELFISQTPDRFHSLQKLARQEVMRQFFIEQKHEYAIYSAYLILSEDSTCLSAKTLIANSLNTLAIYKTQSIPEPDPEVYIVPLKPIVTNTDNQLIPFKLASTGEIAGQAQHINFLLHKLSYTELYVLALDWQWKNFKAQTKKDHSIELIQISRLMWMIKNYSALQPIAFSPLPFSPISLAKKYDHDGITSFTVKRSPSTSFTPPSQILNSSATGGNGNGLRQNNTQQPLFTGAPKQSLGQISTNHDINQNEAIYKSNLNKVPATNTFFTTSGSRLITDASATVQWKGMPDDSAYSYTYVYYLYAFTEHKKDSTFNQLFKNSKPQGRTSPVYEYQMQNRIVYDNRSKYGLGADTILIGRMKAINYKEVQRTRTYAFNDQLLGKYTEYQKNALSAIRDNRFSYPKIPDLSVLNSTDISSYNNWCLLQTWTREHDNYSAFGFSLPPLAYSNLGDSVSKAYHSPYITTTYAVSYLMNSTGDKSQMVSLVYELKTGYMVMYLHQEKNNNATQDIQNRYYDFFLRKSRYPRIDK